MAWKFSGRFMILYISVITGPIVHGAEVCVEQTPHKDVNANTPASIVEKVGDSQQCLSRCASLKDTLPCRGAVYVQTTARGATKALCKMYGKSVKGGLTDVTGPDHNDATYFEVLDQCIPAAQRVNVETGASASGPGAQVDPTVTTAAPINPAPGGVVIVQPGPGSSIPGPGPGPAVPGPAPATPGPDQGGSGGLPVVPPVGAVTPAPDTTTAMVITQAPMGPGGGGGAFVPGPSGGGGNGAFVPGPNAGGGGAFVPAPQGGAGGNGANIGPDPQPAGGGGVYPQPAGGVYPQAGGAYTPPPSYATDGYAPWAAWGPCSATCGGGVMYRTRVCGSGACQGPDKGLKPCMSRRACPQWGPWTEWGPCSSACGGGTQTRSRTCQAGYGCMGSSSDSKSCSSYGSCNPQPQPQPYVPVPVPVYIPRPAPAPPPVQQPHSYYDAIRSHNQYYNRG